MNTPSARHPVHLRFLAAVILTLSAFTQAHAENSNASGWQYGAEIYMWGASLNTKTTGGQKVTIPFHQILSDLDMTFMGAFAARKDKWTLANDVVYMSISQKESKDHPEFTSYTDLSLKSWIVTPTVGYAFVDSSDARIEVVGGARYLWMKAGVKIETESQTVFDKAASDKFWDAIIGLRANFKLNEKWFVPAYVDVGWGDSDNTWQGMLGVGYNFSKFSTQLTYRYLSYEFDSPVLADLVVKGPFLGALFRF